MQQSYLEIISHIEGQSLLKSFIFKIFDILISFKYYFDMIYEDFIFRSYVIRLRPIHFKKKKIIVNYTLT